MNDYVSKPIRPAALAAALAVAPSNPAAEMAALNARSSTGGPDA
jgi:CheY-like chemotaxis protein